MRDIRTLITTLALSVSLALPAIAQQPAAPAAAEDQVEAVDEEMFDEVALEGEIDEAMEKASRPTAAPTDPAVFAEEPVEAADLPFDDEEFEDEVPEGAEVDGEGEELPPGAEADVADAKDAAEWSKTTLKKMGFDDGIRNYVTNNLVSFPIQTRKDRMLTAARVTVEIGEGTLGGGDIAGLDILINNERLRYIDSATVRSLGNTIRTRINSRLLTDDNHITFRLVPSPGAVCKEAVSQGAWRVIDNGFVETRAMPLTLGDDLSILPLPFYDAADEEAVVPIVMLLPPSPQAIRTAGILAAWLGLRTGSKVRFEAHVGKLPNKSGIVMTLADGPGAAYGIGTGTTMPTVSMMDHPKHPGSNVKLMVVSGRDIGELETAVLAMANSDRPLSGKTMTFKSAPDSAVREAYDAPRWTATDEPVRLWDVNGGSALEHVGSGGGTMAVQFRVPPDVFVWPAEAINMDIDFSIEVPAGMEPPAIKVEVNGHYITELRTPDAENGQITGQQQLIIPRDYIKGYNEVRFHVDVSDNEQQCAPTGTEMRTRIAATSALHLEGFPHFAVQPNLQMFVHDGFPFTKFADLSETAFVLSDTMPAEEISTMLSIMAHFAAVTGIPGTRVNVLTSNYVQQADALEKDLIVLGAPGSQTLLSHWADSLPLDVTASIPTGRHLSFSQSVVQVLEGRRSGKEAERAAAMLAGRSKYAGALAMESPLGTERTVVFVTASTTEHMPMISDLQGNANSREYTGDVLLAVGDRLAQFRIGPGWEAGELSTWTRWQWVLASHWLLLFPAFLMGVILFAFSYRDSLRARAEGRLSLRGM
ncbi:MAG: hypothetical protein ACI9WU_000890, partial [Myxococcota bacterium]